MTNRILVVVDAYPWPMRDGYRQRVGHIVEMLARRAEVDLFVVVEPDEATAESAEAAARVAISVVARRSRFVGAAVGLLTGSPRRISQRAWGPARAQLREFAAGPYDLVWFEHADTYAALRTAVPAGLRAVVDLDNLEDWTLRRSRSAGVAEGALTLVGGLRSWLGLVLDRIDECRWRRLQRRIRESAAYVTVCSQSDQRRLGGPRTMVVPNGYEWNGPAADLPRPPVLLMVGMFRYAPNLEAARFLGKEVVPLLRAEYPEAEVRIVGRHDDRLLPLGQIEGLSVIGEVDEISSELAAARVAVVPVLSGSGTRIKILEAWAHGLPVVATSIGCDGLAAEDGEHLLVADTPEEFASACGRLLLDDELWRTIAGGGHRLWNERFRWIRVAEELDRILDDLGRESRTR